MKKGASLQAFLEKNCDVELAKLLYSVAEGSKVIANAIRNVGLLDLTGHTGETNVQGETVQKLDDFSNKVLMDFCNASEVCAGYLSEENEGIETLNENGIFTIAVDPLDGSSNIDVVAPIGTIFSINKRISPAGKVNEADFLQKGEHTVAAGYVIYGSSTVLVFSMKESAGVNMFTLNTEDNQFNLSLDNVRLLEDGKIYSINQGNLGKFEDAAQRFIEHCTEHHHETERPFALRYIGSMVGDLHRTFIKGGVFLYPAAKGETKGKLRLLYECIPMSFLTLHAGGSATDGRRDILSIQPTDIHERCAIIIGSKNMVDKYLEFANQQ
jgi:fructose-1,6-bisphosphatase I